MGAVYVARHQTLGSLRALKVIHDDIKAQPTMAERFKREALALARLQHPSIVSVVDYGQLDNGWPYLMLEFVAGADLSKI
jgi:serine/threonine-protein kinase